MRALLLLLLLSACVDPALADGLRPGTRARAMKAVAAAAGLQIGTQSFDFDGVNDHIRSNDADVFSATYTEFSYACWIKPSSADTSHGTALLARRAGTAAGSVEGAQIVVNRSGNADECRVTVMTNNLDAASCVAQDVWNLLVVSATFDPDQVYLWGLKVGTESTLVERASTTTIVQTSMDLLSITIGARENNTLHFEGRISECAFWAGDALTLSEANELHSSGAATLWSDTSVGAGITHWFRMGDGYDLTSPAIEDSPTGTVYDMSGGGWHTSVLNMAADDEVVDAP